MGKKKKKDKKPVGGLMAGLIKAGVVSQKDARKIRREQREEVKAEKKAHGHKGVEELEKRKLEELAALAEARKDETRQAEAARVERSRRERLRRLLGSGLFAAGRRRFYFVRPDRFIDFVEVDDMTVRQLEDREVIIARDPARRAGDYVLLAKSWLGELRELAPELVLFPPAARSDRPAA